MTAVALSPLATRALQVQATAGNRALGRMIQASRPVLARQLIATGDFERFRAIAEPASGLLLSQDAATGAITAIGTLPDPATSPAFASQLLTIMDHPTQNAEVTFGAAQAGVLVGAFPQPSDMTGSRVQQIDLDDIEAMEAGAPGHGLAALAHELGENFEAHAHTPAAGTDLFPGAHGAGIAAENAVLADTVGPGVRQAERVAAGATANTQVFAGDYEDHYLVLDITLTPPADFQISSARNAARTLVSEHVIDRFVTGSNALPPGGFAAVTAALADLVAHPQSTVGFEGFCDDVGSAAVNDALSQRRADAVRDIMVAAGGAPLRNAMHTHGRGQTNFLNGNATEDERAQNRRVVIRVEEPAPP